MRRTWGSTRNGIAGSRLFSTVPAGGARVIRAGNEDVLQSGPLTVCSTFVGQIVRNRVVLGVLMAHRGPESRESFLRNLDAELESQGIDGEFELVPVAVQHAPHTRLRHRVVEDGVTRSHDDTLFELAHNLETRFGLAAGELMNMSEVGPGINLVTSQCTATVRKDGSVDVPKRKGAFETCICM